MNKRIINIRAFAIIVIVLGHSIILYSKQWGIYTTCIDAPILSLMKNIINSFQLELFFALSGFLFYKSVKKQDDIALFFKKKATRLIIPYYFIAYCWMDPIKIFLATPGFTSLRESINSINYQLTFSGGSTGHLWFLPTLFLIFIFSYIFMTKIYKSNIYGISVLILTLVLAYYIGFHLPDYFQFNNVLHYAIFFFMGYFLYYINSYTKLSKYKSIIVLSFIFFSICRIFTIYVHLAYILSFILFIYTLMPERVNKYVKIVSDNSFGIYLYHSPLIYITYTYFKDSNPLLVVFLNFVVFGSISLLLSIITRKSKFKFILGE